MRDDDREEVISGTSRGLRDSDPLVDYYRLQGRLVPVNADQTMAEVAAQIFGVIDGHVSIASRPWNRAKRRS